MRLAEERLKTFTNWPHSSPTPQELASNGFYYLGRGDEVRCVFCKVEIMTWEEGDDPAVDHERWSPQCPFVRNQCNDPSPFNPPAHPRLATVAARLRTFEDWPRCIEQRPEQLAEAGFFYTGRGDKTLCFYCDGGLKDWEVGDVPWEQHARWFGDCKFVRLVKGKEFVQRVITDACAMPATSAETETPTTESATPAETEAETSQSCKICFDNERDVVILPCGHVTCAQCALATLQCPFCRTTINGVKKLYFN